MQQVLAFAALIVPGFISLRVYELRCGTESRKANESLVDVIVYSFATDVIGMAALSLVALVVPPAAQPIARACVAVAVLVVLPMTIAFVWSDVQRRMVRYGVFRETVADPWDHIFDAVVQQRIDVAVIVTLRDGRKVGARLRRPAPVGSYVRGAQLLLGEVWTIEAESATFLEPVPGSFGVLLDKADCETAEFIEWSEAGPHPRTDIDERAK